MSGDDCLASGFRKNAFLVPKVDNPLLRQKALPHLG